MKDETQKMNDPLPSCINPILKMHHPSPQHKVNPQLRQAEFSPNFTLFNMGNVWPNRIQPHLTAKDSSS
jgi:hypothetical protein